MGSMTSWALRWRAQALLEILPHVGFDRVFNPDHFLHALKVSPKEEKKEAKKKKNLAYGEGGNLSLYLSSVSGEPPSFSPHSPMNFPHRPMT